MELGTLANVAEIIGAVMVVGGLSFAIIEINHFRQQRRDMAAIELGRSFQNPEFARALRVVLSLPSGITADQMRDGDPAWEDAAMLVSLTLESVGIMVHRRIVSIEMVWELMGGVTLSVWDRLEAWVGHTRKAEGSDKFDEWIQWLAEQLRRHMKEAGIPPAYHKYREWRP